MEGPERSYLCNLFSNSSSRPSIDAFVSVTIETTNHLNERFDLTHKPFPLMSTITNMLAPEAGPELISDQSPIMSTSLIPLLFISS